MCPQSQNLKHIDYLYLRYCTIDNVQSLKVDESVYMMTMLRLSPMQNSSVYTLYMITVKNNDYYVCIHNLQTPNYSGRVEDNL